jgi:hypothetical protein
VIVCLSAYWEIESRVTGHSIEEIASDR